MLIAMRKGAAGWVAKLLFALLILSFAVWGIGDYLTPETNAVVAKVGEVEIRRLDVEQAERRQIDQMRRLLGNQFNAADLPEGALRQAAVDQLVGQAALDMETIALGIGVSDQGIGDAIRANPEFQLNGVFDPNRFRNALFSAGLNEEIYAQSMRTELRRAQLGGAVAAKLPPPLPLVEAMYVLENQKRGVAYVTLDTSSIEAPEPTDADLRAYVEANADAFAEPERRDARAIVISEQSVARTIEISETEVANRYEDFKEQFRIPATRTLVQALFQDETEARAFAGGAPGDRAAFEEQAEIAGGSVVDLGELTRGQVFPAALGDAAFAAGAGPVGTPVQTALGWHVLFVESVQDAAFRPLDDVKDDLKTQMQREQAIERLTDISNAAEDELAAGGDLERAAASSGMPIVRLEGIDRRGVDRNGSVSLEMPADPGYLSAIFERTVGEQSGLIELRNGVYVALIVDKVHPTAPKPFDAVREQARQQWQAEKRLEIGEGRLKALTDATSLAAFESAAAEAGVEPVVVEPSLREDLAAGGALPVPFIETIFAARENAAVSTDDRGTVIVAFVNQVDRPVFDPNSEAGREYIAAMTDAYANDRVEALAAMARNVHPAIVDLAAAEPPPMMQQPAPTY